ncbi:CBS domain containing-hemolysin-like protein [Mesonia hippocampi]|uniref:CBS domain containing-hemolysin-like protein n=1 Tax=Mesonia hippocampi TaxID=1628250 RepID=A0A840EQZ0_9FLAO|nr:hemolysin family protein [Mesonia hippocampi]MBB4119380.1 CBS domain containing-hemolysin-like protein [Mesonia hippocampi]
MNPDIIIIIISLLLSAFFSGMEIAYVSSNKVQVEIEKKQAGFLSSVLEKLTRKPSKFIATMLVGNNVALVIYGFYMGGLLTNWLASFQSEVGFLTYLFTEGILLTKTIISTLVILITAEFLPKVFFQIYANTMLKILALPAYIFYIVFSPISSFVIGISDFVLKHFFKTKGDEVQLAFSKVELGNYISEQMGAVEKDEEIDSEVQLFKNALDFSDVKAREVMIPRTEIVAVDSGEAIDKLAELFTETGLSKILVYNDSVDDIIGYVHSFQLFKRPKNITSVMRSVVYVPETMLIKDVLNVLTKRRKSIAVVVDEYGGTSGIMTTEDIVEELFGEIEDEHDSPVLIEEQLNENLYRFSARMEVDYINETYKLNLPEEENYETLGGLIVNQTEEIPEQGGTLYIQDYKLTVLEVSNTKIELVEVECIENQ